MKKQDRTFRKVARKVIWVPIEATCAVLLLNTIGITHFNQFQLAMLANILVLGRCAMGFGD